jgi:hypothetical protein
VPALFVDAPQITEHLKDPRKYGHIREDIEAVNEHLDTIESEMAAGSVVCLLEGNHEKRVWKHATRYAKGLLDLVKSWPEVYGLKERNGRKCKWEWHELNKWDSLRIGDTVVHHGFYFDKNVAHTNLTRYCSYGVNFLQGHTHRRQYASNGRYFSASCGHGAIAEKIAHNPTPVDWEQTITLLENYKGRSTLEQYEVVNGVARIRGRLVKG